MSGLRVEVPEVTAKAIRSLEMDPQDLALYKRPFDDRLGMGMQSFLETC